MARFWRFENTMEPGGVFYYLDPGEIVGVNYEEPQEKGDSFYSVILRSGDYYFLTEADGRRLMKWAESAAESIPEVGPTMVWKVPA